MAFRMKKGIEREAGGIFIFFILFRTFFIREQSGSDDRSINHESLPPFGGRLTMSFGGGAGIRTPDTTDMSRML